MGNKTSGGKLGFYLIGLGTAFIFLRMFHIISWPWVWVMTPFWILIGLWTVVAIAAILMSIYCSIWLKKH